MNKEEHKAHKREYDKIYYHNNKKTILNNKTLYYQEHKDEKHNYNQRYQKENQKQISKQKIERLKNNPTIRLVHNLRSYLRLVLKGKIKSQKTIQLIGCTFENLITHFENQFTEGMSWDNYGNKIGQWSIDHIKPCSLFDLSISKQQQQCFNYKNLRPMWHIDNIKKSNKYKEIEHAV